MKLENRQKLPISVSMTNLFFSEFDMISHGKKPKNKPEFRLSAVEISVSKAVKIRKNVPFLVKS
jgi:hypothetical protein